MGLEMGGEDSRGFEMDLSLCMNCTVRWDEFSCMFQWLPPGLGRDGSPKFIPVG